jgi:hypothetical protein
MTIIINAQGTERKRLVQTISAWLDLPARYCGAPSFSYEVGCITIDKTGSVVIGDGLSDETIERLTQHLYSEEFDIDTEFDLYSLHGKDQDVFAVNAE